MGQGFDSVWWVGEVLVSERRKKVPPQCLPFGADFIQVPK